MPDEAAPSQAGMTIEPENHSRPSKLRSSSFARSSERLELTFTNLEYSVKLERKNRVPDGPKEKKILINITGMFKPGRLTAIMGSSGAGKTTLLSVLAGNIKTGTVEGTVLVNGEHCSSRMLKEISGFVFQDDVLLATMTVREAIAMSALLRLPKAVSNEERNRRVNDILELMHLEKARNTIVGSPLQKGISGGERKRTAIAMEMVINPAMLFLDEPTTGLDTFTAFTVMLSLKRLAKQGRTVVATIHQPSTEIFNLFDDLAILSRGRIAYFGPVKKVISYFAQQGYQCPQYSNPADYIFMRVLREFGTLADDDDEEDRTTNMTQRMETSRQSLVRTGSADMMSDSESERRAAGTGQVPTTVPKLSNSVVESPCLPKTAQEICDERIESLLEVWKKSPEQQTIMEECKDRPKRGVAYGLLRRRAPLWTQFEFLLRRSLNNFLRNRSLIATRFFQAVFIGLIVGLIYIKTNDYGIQVQIRNKSGALYFIAVNLFFAATSQILGIFGIEKQVFYREYNGGYYSTGPYYVSKTLIEIPGQIIGPYLLVIICYYMIGLSPSFSDYLLIATLGALGALCGNAYGTLIAALVDDLNIALAVAPLCILPLIVVSGIFVAALPVYINWLKYISPIYYSFSGMLQTQFDRPIENCDPTVGLCTGDQVFAELNFEDTFPPGVSIVFLVSIFIILWTSGLISLYVGARRKK